MKRLLSLLGVVAGSAIGLHLPVQAQTLAEFYQPMQPTNRAIFGGVGYGETTTTDERENVVSQGQRRYWKQYIPVQMIASLSCVTDTHNADQVSCYGERNYRVIIAPEDQWRVVSDYNYEDRLVDYQFAHLDDVGLWMKGRPLENNPRGTVELGVNF